MGEPGILKSNIAKNERGEGVLERAEKLLVVVKLEGDNQGGEKIQGILEERVRKMGTQGGRKIYF